MLSLGTIELSWHLITEAQARIHDSDGGGDIMVKVGSNIELNCTVHSGDRVHHSLAVFWYLDGKVIDWMGQTGNGKGVQVIFHKRSALYPPFLILENKFSFY